jgi:hypothetical protein
MQQLTSETSPLDVKAFFTDWVMVKSRQTDSVDPNQEYCIVWLAEQPPAKPIVEAAQKLCALKNAIPGAQLECKLEPQLGFVLKPQKGWRFDTQNEAQQILEKVVWEVNRLGRS